MIKVKCLKENPPEEEVLSALENLSLKRSLDVEYAEEVEEADASDEDQLVPKIKRIRKD